MLKQNYFKDFHTPPPPLVDHPKRYFISAGGSIIK